MKFGIFLHWGIYSMFGQGEWYMQNANLDWREYEKAASAFYPHQFDAREWVQAIKASGARYITFTSRHHDSFSMWKTDQSDFNIVDATPYGRDVVGQLADACREQGLRLHLYYSHLDWRRADYPLGRTGLNTHRDLQPNWQTYLSFMEGQLTELLTRYGDIGAIWFDGVWDHDQDTIPFNWDLDRQYALIHQLQPRCLVGNNHHEAVKPGEDIQIFMWGYKITDQNYKSVEELIRLLVSTSGKGANLLLNIGPQPNGKLPAAALERLRGMGEWLSRYGESIYGTRAGDIPEQAWGATTRKGDVLYVHVTDRQLTDLTLPLTCKVKDITVLNDGSVLKDQQNKEGLILTLPQHESEVDYILKITTK